MRTKLLYIGLFLVIIGSCSYPNYLPSSTTIGVNEYGSYIVITPKVGINLSGELIAVDSNRLYVLNEDLNNNTTVYIPIADIYSYKLRYAQPKHYGWTIPVFLASTIAHGYFLILTAPINLITTIAVTSSGERAFTYNERNLSYAELRMFARFPAGVPKNIDFASIK